MFSVTVPSPDAASSASKMAREREQVQGGIQAPTSRMLDSDPHYTVTPLWSALRKELHEASPFSAAMKLKADEFPCTPLNNVILTVPEPSIGQAFVQRTDSAESRAKTKKQESKRCQRIEHCIQKLGSLMIKLSTSAASPAITRSWEMRTIRAEERRAGCLEDVIKRWQNQLPAGRRSEIDLTVWQNYQARLPNANTFSVFLSKLAGGFTRDFRLPHFSMSKGFYNPKKPVFAEQRLLPVLLAMQKNPLLAERLFCLAEDGLGACHDRPPLTFIDMELEAQSDAKISEIYELSDKKGPAFAKSCNELIAIEHQKLRKAWVVAQLQEKFKHTRRVNYDPLQSVVITYKAIAKRHRDYFPTLPFTTSCSNQLKEDIDRISREVPRNYEQVSSSNLPTLLENHLMSSDTWLKLMVNCNPDLGFSLEYLERQRDRLSQNLLNLPESSFQDHYAKDIEALKSGYLQARSNLVNNRANLEWTRDLIVEYLLSPEYNRRAALA